MLTLKGNNYTTEDKIFLQEVLQFGLAHYVTPDECLTGNFCPTCPCKNACADLFRLKQYAERFDIR